MATMRDIKRRIKGVKNIQQITKAMKMVAAAKLRRSQDRMLGMRPYAASIENLVGRLMHNLAGDENPLLAQVENPTKTLVIIMTSDRGLCGGFNSNVIRRTNHLLDELADQEVSLLAIGRKGYRFFRKRDYEMAAHYIGIFDSLSYSLSNTISDFITNLFFEGKTEQVFLVYNEFKSVLHQTLKVKKILPFDVETLRGLGIGDTMAKDRGEATSAHLLNRSEDPQEKPIVSPEAGSGACFTFEPDEVGVCNRLLPRYLSTEIFRSLLESYASELAARMTAMDSATQNAGEMIDHLTLTFNRARQASITQEISEIVGGANALQQV